MATKKTSKSKLVYQLKVILEGIKPPIWRRLLIPAELTLADLGQIIEVAMGWGGGHLHEFVIADEHYGSTSPDFGMNDDDVIDESRVKLAKVLPKEKGKFHYTYDFGDNWEHTITVEKILPAEPGAYYPRCVTGKRHGPPDDCGGIWGYADFVEAMADPKHPQHEELREWYAGDFDPEAFDVDPLNKRLGHPG